MLSMFWYFPHLNSNLRLYVVLLLSVPNALHQCLMYVNQDCCLPLGALRHSILTVLLLMLFISVVIRFLSHGGDGYLVFKWLCYKWIIIQHIFYYLYISHLTQLSLFLWQNWTSFCLFVQKLMFTCVTVASVTFIIFSTCLNFP